MARSTKRNSLALTIILVLTLVALAYLTYYSFRSSSAIRISTQVNPESIKPNAFINQNNETFANYYNQDLTENYYSINIPKSWQLKSSVAGEYDFIFNDGIAKINMMDVPDNTNLNLYILSQEEPNFKTTLIGYEKIDYKTITVNGNEAHQLTYFSKVNGVAYKTIRTYISGQDHTAVITFSLLQSSVYSFTNTFTSIINSFAWRNN